MHNSLITALLNRVWKCHSSIKIEITLLLALAKCLGLLIMTRYGGEKGCFLTHQKLLHSTNSSSLLKFLWKSCGSCTSNSLQVPLHCSRFYSERIKVDEILLERKHWHFRWPQERPCHFRCGVTLNCWDTRADFINCHSSPWHQPGLQRLISWSCNRGSTYWCQQLTLSL